MKDTTTARGFTIIELIIVIAIIAIIASIVIAAISSYKTKSHDARRAYDIAQIQNALNLYRNDHGQYPPSGGATYPDSGWSTSSDASWNTLATALAPYINPLPKDPLNVSTYTSNPWGATGQIYSYYSQGVGNCNQQWYMLVYTNEVNKSPTNPGVLSCDGVYYNYAQQSYPGASSATVTIGASAK